MAVFWAKEVGLESPTYEGEMLTWSDIAVRARCYRRAPISALGRALRLCGAGPILPRGLGRFPPSKLASSLLVGLKGVEIGGSAGNAFGLDTLNVDAIDHRVHQTIYAHEQLRVCGDVMPVDLIAPGDKLPLADGAVDFVISSHVIEHFYDPIAAIVEWVRVARRFVYVIAPHKERMFDRDRDVTSARDLIERHRAPRPPGAGEDRHWSVWRTRDFVELIESLGLPIAAVQDVDDKIGNGFAVVIGDLEKLDRANWLDRQNAPLESRGAAS